MRVAPRKTAFQLLRVLVVLYSAAAVGWYLLVRTPAAGWWPVQLLEVFEVWFYLPLPLLLLPILFRRDWNSGVWLMLPLLVFGNQYGQLFLPGPVAKEGVPFKVMTANVYFQNRDASAVAELVAREQPDVLAMQELGTALAGPLGDRLRERYPYQALHPNRSSRGMGIISRYPIVGETAPEMGPGECSCQQLTLDVNGRQVTILNVHPSRPEIDIKRLGPTVIPSGFSTGEQESAMLALRHRASTVTTPLLIVGDFNTTDREKPYRVLSELYRDVYREAGWGLGFTYPSVRRGIISPFPVLRIDYIFRDDTWAANTARVIGVPGSDHNGVIAELALTQDLSATWTATVPKPR